MSTNLQSDTCQTKLNSPAHRFKTVIRVVPTCMTQGGRNPADVYGLLGDEIRIEILMAMARARHRHERESLGGDLPGLSFSDIYDEVGVDNTSKLSYHLGELDGTFLQKTEDGYTFTHAGDQLVRTILAGNYEPPPEFEPTDVEGTCPYCGEESLRSTLGNAAFFVTCTACDRPIVGYGITAAQVRSHEADELIDSVAVTMGSAYSQVRSGVCPWCSGRLATELLDEDDLELPAQVSVLVQDRCEHCLRQYNAPLPYRAAYHPASIGFHWDHGIDITATGMWEMHHYNRTGQWTADRNDGSATYRVVLRQDREALRLFLDDGATVTRTERVRGRALE